MNTFSLSKEPVDIQLSVHISNMLETYGEFMVMSNYDYIRYDGNDFDVVYSNIRPTNESERLASALFGMACYYGFDRIDEVLNDLFNIKTNLKMGA